MDSNGQTKEDLRVIVRETRRCSEIVKRLLEFARQAPSYKTVIDINSVIDRAISIVNNQLTISNISVHNNIKNNLPRFKADDANQMYQIFINLFLNAADAMDDQGGDITISNHLINIEGVDYIEIKISDTGCGIPPENLSKIFDPFFTTKGHKGTGLGRAVVWGIIEEHNGTINVESNVGNGTVFKLQLPTSKEEKASVLLKKNSGK